MPSPHDDRALLRDVRAGRCSVMRAAFILGWDIDDVQMAAFGKIVR